MTSPLCDNLNHRRSNSPVRCCPKCGAVVNARISTRHCSKATHDRSRRNQNLFCVDCGEMLRRDTSGLARLPH
ncbi:MAG: hypothetical protein ALAOOOJD_03621 [bacterium]|nr:hypothetical protein [bacterium]